MKTIPVRKIASALKEPAPSGSFSIRKIETLLAGNDMVQELHRHDFFYVLVLEKGIGAHSIDFVNYPVNDHAVFFMRPGQVHDLILRNGSKGYLMEFAAGFYSPYEQTAIQVLRKVSNKHYCSFNANGFQRLVNILSAVFEEYSARREMYLDVIQSILGIFFIELLRQSTNPQSLPNEGGAYNQDRLEELLEMIAQHFTGHKQVAYYANALHLTGYQLNTITKATLGKTCSEVINDYILLEAKRYLLTTANQVNQIAWHLGYEDVSYFIRFFKKHTGLSPDAFRQNFK